MHIAVINSFPAVLFTAEMEYIHRFAEAARRTGHQAYEVVTSDDINDCRPDFVIATHEFSPKLTEYFTFGAMWGPYSYILDDARKLRSVLSYDAYLVGSSKVHGFLDAVEFATGVRKPRSNFTFLPTALSSAYESRPLNRALSLSYVGVHWDGLRHNGLLKELNALGSINIYGPANSWVDYAASYRGPLAFDGKAVANMLTKHGIALCIHKDEHRNADTPSMRIFEAAAAGCLIIVDEIPFAKRVLGDSVFHIDLRQPAGSNARRICEIIRWANENRGAAEAMAIQSHKILNETLSIETLVKKCCEFSITAKEEVRQRQEEAVKYFLPTAKARADAALERVQPLVDIIIRTGGRDITKLRRAIKSIKEQTLGSFRVLLVDYKGRADIERFTSEESTPRLQIDYINCPDTGLRSTSLWHGLRAVKAPFFAMLDDDDTVMSSHFAHLMATAREFPDHVLYYSGSILHEEDPGHHMNPVNFNGPMEIDFPERRELKFMDVYNLARICKLDNYILTHSWIARSSCLDERTLLDPELEVAEDMYLYFMLARIGSFRLAPSPTAIWHFRSTNRDNSMLGVASRTWDYDTKKLLLRLSQEVMHNGSTLGEMRHQLGLPAPRVHEPTIPVRSVPLQPGELTTLSAETLRGCQMLNVHAPEAYGIWTSSPDASIHLRLESQDRALHFKVQFRANGTPTHGKQFASISINGVSLFTGLVTPWQLNTVEGDVYLPEAIETIVLRARCAYVAKPPSTSPIGDQRLIGIFLSTIEYTASGPTSLAQLLEPARD